MREMTVYAGKLRFHVLEFGSGPPVLLLHGGATTGAVWTAVATLLAPRWRVYAPDLRGHGRSSWQGKYTFDNLRDDVFALMDALGIGAARLAGHSMGGVVAYLAAAARPERVDGLVLLETPPPVPLGLKTPEREPGRADYHRDARLRLIAQLNAPPAEWWDALAGITTPTVVVGGGEESFLPQEAVREMAARVPGAEFVEIPVGHGVVRAAPRRVAGVIEGVG